MGLYGTNLYIVKDEEGFIKIGVSYDVPERMKSLKHQRKSAITLLNVVPDVSQYESSLHNHYAPYALGGEWFDLNEIHINYLTGLTKSQVMASFSEFKRKPMADGSIPITPIKMPLELKAKAKARSEEEGMSLSAWIYKVIESYLNSTK